ncbi:protein S100-A13-like [Rhinatrema bivittatum]|uniref:protein S100-A13-like n=1 Tax=Rhinatrema bivittatum TaxID=194408 RepID=UPI001125C400|nr:protein S100-A13-like [Rhinatrema bivittatum]
MAANATELENGIKVIVYTFFTYSQEEGKENTLTLTEFTKMVNQELPNIMKDAGPLDEKMKAFDVNQDQELTFSEYWRLIGLLARDIKKENYGKKK